MDKKSKAGKCPACIKRCNTKYDIDDVQRIVSQNIGPDYVVISYTGKRNLIQLLHKKCNSNITMYLGNIEKGQRCRICESGFLRMSDAMKFDADKFSTSIEKRFKGLFSLAGEYIDYKTHTKIKCNTCNNVFTVAPTRLVQSAYCPFCNSTAGEQMIAKILKKENIYFKIQEPITIDNRIYKFDFYVPSKNVFIEYDGKQHFKASFGKTREEREKNLELTRVRDAKKDKYCEENMIKLIRIPYTKFNTIYDILLSEGIISSTTIESTVDTGSE